MNATIFQLQKNFDPRSPSARQVANIITTLFAQRSDAKTATTQKKQYTKRLFSHCLDPHSMTKPALVKLDKELSLPIKSGDYRTWANLKGSAPALAIVEAAAQHKGLTLVICADNETVDRT
ncbi:MAG: hypothetical protein COB04_19120, partial [Gammaproteobacteria bacterium]